MHVTPRPRQPHNTPDTEPHAQLSRLRRRCIIGILIAAPVFILAFVIDLIRATPSDDTAVIGVEVAAAATGAACGVTAMVTTGVTLLSDERQADAVSWAWQLGAKVADAYPAARLNGAAPRTPNIR